VKKSNQKSKDYLYFQYKKTLRVFIFFVFSTLILSSLFLSYLYYVRIIIFIRSYYIRITVVLHSYYDRITFA